MQPTKTGGLISESSDPTVAIETSDDTPLEAPSDLEDKNAFNFPRVATNRWSWMQNLPQKLRGPSFNLGGTSPTTQRRTSSASPGNSATFYPTVTKRLGMSLSLSYTHSLTCTHPHTHTHTHTSSEHSPDHPASIVVSSEANDMRQSKPITRNITNRLR